MALCADFLNNSISLKWECFELWSCCCAAYSNSRWTIRSDSVPMCHHQHQGEKDNKFRRSRWLRSPWVTTIKFVHIRGESERLAYDIITSSMSVLGGLACWTCLHDFMSFRLKQTQSNVKKSINDLNRRINLVLKYTMIYWWGLGLGRVSAFMNL